MGYRMKQKYSITLAIREKFQVERRSLLDMNTVGGHIHWVLFYKLNTEQPIATEATLVCDHCLNPEYHVTCNATMDCVHQLAQVYEDTADNGRNLKWVILPKDNLAEITAAGNGKYNPSLDNCVFPQLRMLQRFCANVTTKNVVLNYLVGSLNNSVLRVPQRRYIMMHRTPEIAWSEDDDRLEDVAVMTGPFPIQIFPMVTQNMPKTKLRFVTADGVYQSVPSLALYTQPLDIATWLWAFALLMLIIILVVTVSKTNEGGAISCSLTLKWSTYWIYGALIEQVNDCILPPTTHTSGRKVSVKTLQLVVLFLAFMLNNLYRAVLSFNYLAGNELITSWHRVDQLQNFSSLYVPLSACVWKAAEYNVRHGMQVKILPDSVLMTACSHYYAVHCAGPLDHAPCLLQEERTQIRVAALADQSCRRLKQMLHRNATELGKSLTNCHNRRTRTFWSLNQRLKYFPAEQLGSYVRNELRKEKTALLSTEEMLPLLWKEFEKAMRENRGLKFSHNYFSPEDDPTITRKGARVIVGSGMKSEHTKLVTDRVHSLLLSGIWDFWVSIDRVRQARDKRVVLERVVVPDFAPLTLQHDGIYLLFVLTGALLCVSVFSFSLTVILAVVRIETE